MEKITVRDACREDAADIAGLLVMAWPVEDFLRMQPGLTLDGLVGFIRTFVEAEDTLYSYRYTVVAVLKSDDGDERIVGVMNGYDGAEYETLKRPVMAAIAASFESGDDFGRVKETEAGEFYLDSAAVDPEMRSKGIGSMLFDAMTERAVRQGFDTVGLIVDEDKPRAEALYLRLGYKTVGCKDFMGHRMLHMQKKI